MSQQTVKSPESNGKTLAFMAILSIVCAVILSSLASVLATPIDKAKDLDRSKQMLIASKILDHNGYFTLPGDQGTQLAEYHNEGYLHPLEEPQKASDSQILELYKNRMKPLLTDDKGNLFTFESVKINPEFYLSEYRKTGYYKEPYKLVYKILPNPSKNAAEKVRGQEVTSLADAEGWVLPVNGMGLWDAIYGYLAIEPDGISVKGITWYDQKETPGLGANISEEDWQSLFPGKKIFQENSSGKIDVKKSPVGIVVVRGKVSDSLGESTKAKNAVDGMAGATLTGNGVTDAYSMVLEAYRPFLEKVHEQSLLKH